MLATLTLALSLAAPVPKAVPVEEPKGTPPTLQYVKGDATLFTATRHVNMTEAVPVVKEQVVPQANGVPVAVKVTVMETRTVTKPVKVTYAAKGATFRTAGGRKLAAEDAEARLKAGEVCVLAQFGQTVDRAYLAVLKEETLVIQLPEPPPPMVLPIPAGGIPVPPAPLPAPVQPPAPKE